MRGAENMAGFPIEKVLVKNFSTSFTRSFQISLAFLRQIGMFHNVMFEEVSGLNLLAADQAGDLIEGGRRVLGRQVSLN